jgi:hypothetical protein
MVITMKDGWSVKVKSEALLVAAAAAAASTAPARNDRIWWQQK